VTVFTPAPGGGTSTALPFTITAATNPVPALTSLSPSNATVGGNRFHPDGDRDELRSLIRGALERGGADVDIREQHSTAGNDSGQ